MNDSNVRKIREETVLNQQAYLLFYKRANDAQHISIANHNLISEQEKLFIREIDGEDKAKNIGAEVNEARKKQ